jgi:hypothetical protein
MRTPCYPKIYLLPSVCDNCIVGNTEPAQTAANGETLMAGAWPVLPVGRLSTIACPLLSLQQTFNVK